MWDSGGHDIDKGMLERFKEDMNKIIREHHALFGIPSWDNYVTVIQLTDTMRGGLEHLNSQTSMVPRQSLMQEHDDEYRDLVSLFSHEYLHQWNVKRLRPRNMLDYDLQRVRAFRLALVVRREELLGWEICCVFVGAWFKKTGVRISCVK